MPDERVQFRVLYRDFLIRIVDLELLSTRGDSVNLLVQFGALLAAFNLTAGFGKLPYYAAHPFPPERMLTLAWLDQDFWFAITMVVCGLFTVLAWNAVLPDRRDSTVLGLLPVRIRTIAVAKIAAVGTALGVCVVAVNLFTGLGFPVAFLPPSSGWFGLPRAFLAYWIATAAAGLFMCCALLAVQGIAAQVLSYGLFQRVSSVLQLLAFFTVLGGLFLKPEFPLPGKIDTPEYQALLRWFPSFWFVGLFQQLNGPNNPAFRALAERAVVALAIAAGTAAVTFTLGYRRNMRRIVEQPEIAPGDRTRLLSRIVPFLAANLIARPLDRAIVLFTARTIARSRQHRLLLAAYTAAGLAIAFAFARALVYIYMVSSRLPQAWDGVDTPLLTGGMVVLFFTIVGMRTSFSLPIALPSNWIFRITAVHRPAAYFAAVRKAVLMLGALPVWIAAALFYIAIWPIAPAAGHIALLVLAGIFLVYRLFYMFRKIPFTCSYLPGSANLTTHLAFYGLIFLFATDAGMHLELWSLERLSRYVVMFVLVAASTVKTRRRTLEFSESPYNPLQFEAQPPSDVEVLDFRRDGEYGGEQYIDVLPEWTWRRRVLPIVALLVLLACAGAVYEQVGERRDARRFPQVGRSVDIGGRSLNIYCSGDGSPTVILESGFAAAGISWVYVQRELAKFTRACWYDRAGYGWSDPGPFPNHADSAARDLHKLLVAAGVSPPYLLVGDGFTTFHVRVYRRYYPDEVSGLVLLEPFNEDTTVNIHNHNEALRPAVVAFFGALGYLGWSRLAAGPPTAPPPSLTPREWEEAQVMVRQPKTMMARVKEPPIWISGELARTSHGLGDLPLTVLSSGIPTPDWYGETYELRLARNLSLARQSLRGRQMIVPDSQASIVRESPDAIIDAVREMVLELRSAK